jgi:cytochrome c
MRKNLLLAVAAAFLCASSVASAADLAEGAKIFKRCHVCHSLKPGKRKVGPSLFGVIGRKAGTSEGYHYSTAMRHSGLTWNEATLDTYLANPRKVVKGTRMAFPGLKKEQDRQDVIAYIKEKSK